MGVRVSLEDYIDTISVQLHHWLKTETESKEIGPWVIRALVRKPRRRKTTTIFERLLPTATTDQVPVLLDHLRILLRRDYEDKLEGLLVRFHAYRKGNSRQKLDFAYTLTQEVTAADVTAAEVASTATSPSPKPPASESPARQPGSRRRIAKRYTPSQRKEILAYAEQHGVAAASREHGVSRYAIYDWMHKVELAEAGECPSPLEGPAPQEIEEQRDREILTEWKRHPGLGPSQIRNQLRRRAVRVSVQTVRRIMMENGYRPQKVKKLPHDERFEAIRPNHLWHLDFVHQFIHKSKAYVLLLIDDYSRFIVGFCVDEGERADGLVQAFDAAVNRYGRPEMVLHDKGSAFWSWRGISQFTHLLTELGIDQIPAKHKEWNGKLEALNGNVRKEFFRPSRFTTMDEMRHALADYIHTYNHERTHHGLGGVQVPADRYYGRVDEVQALLDASDPSAESFHRLDVSQRTLEPLRIVQRADKMELWVMGRQVLSW